MTRDMQSLMIRFLLIAVFVAAPAAAQAPRPVKDAQTISRGWAAIAAGRLDEAVSLADGILKKKPRSHAAFTLKIEALADGTRPIAALDAYEAWIPKSGPNMDDRGLLEPIATGVLRLLAADPDVLVRTAALEFLANGGDEAALDALRQRRYRGRSARDACTRQAWRRERDLDPANGPAISDWP